MKQLTFTLRVEAIDDCKITCHIDNTREDNSLHYSIKDGAVCLLKDNQLAVSIRKNQHQLQKILRSAIHGKLYVGQVINCVFLENFPFLKDEYFNRFIRLDRRKGKLDITISDTGLHKVHQIFADGSCNHETKQSGYGGFTKAPDGTKIFFHQSFSGGSSNMMELLAVKEGLRRLAGNTTIQVNTDSRFVIRGLVQWVHFWKYNNWQTAYGRNVRYAEHWQQACALCEGKYIEFRWIKGHSGNREQDLCHLLAQAAAQ